MRTGSRLDGEQPTAKNEARRIEDCESAENLFSKVPSREVEAKERERLTLKSPSALDLRIDTAERRREKERSNGGR